MVDEIISEELETLCTKDLYLSAAILAEKAGTLDEIDRTDARHMRFYFSGKRLSAIEYDWTNRTLKVNASDYADSIRRMKSEIHKND